MRSIGHDTLALALGAVLFSTRVLMAIPAIGRHGMDPVVLVNWGCLAVTLVVVECWSRKTATAGRL